MKNLAIFSSKSDFFDLASREKVGQSICNFIDFFLIIIDLKMVLRELLSLVDQSRAQILYIYETTKVVIVSEIEDFVLTALQVVASSFEDFNNS